MGRISSLFLVSPPLGYDEGMDNQPKKLGLAFYGGVLVLWLFGCVVFALVMNFFEAIGFTTPWAS